MSDYKTQIHEYIIAHKDTIVQALKELLKIPSVREEATENAPFGQPCADILAHIRMLYAQNGIETDYYPEQGYTLSYFGKGMNTLGLFAHADVVPASTDWIFTKPFDPIEKDNYLIGRGTIDDKSAVITSLYCIKALKELALPFHSRLICFTGINEESGMKDVQNFVNNHSVPDFSLVIDTGFPLYYGNKGMLQMTVHGNKPLDCIKEITGSNTRGAILGKVAVRLAYSDELYAYLKMHESNVVFVKTCEEGIVVEAVGISKHTALAEGSLNAGSLVAGVLKNCILLSENERKQMTFLTEILSNYYGESIGIANNDPDFGRLTIANDSIELRDGKLLLHFNLRFGAMIDLVQLKCTIKETFSCHDFSVSFENEATAHKMDVHHPMLQRCWCVYREFTEDTKSIPLINAGGTYARYLPCAIEIGTTLISGSPVGTKAGHGGAHQPDECIHIDGFLAALELTLLMLLECDKREDKVK